MGLIGQFVVQPVKDMLTRNLGSKQPRGQIARLILRVVPRTGFGMARQPVAHGVNSATLFRRDHEGLLERPHRIQRSRMGEEPLLGRKIGLVQHKRDMGAISRNGLGQRLRLLNG